MTILAETITAERLNGLLDDESIDVVHRALWLLLWESDVRILDLLALEVTDILLEERRIRPSSGSPSRLPDGEAAFSDRAAGLLTRVVGGRTTGPLFAAGGRAVGWETVVREAAAQGQAVHAFRAGGRIHRQTTAVE